MSSVYRGRGRGAHHLVPLHTEPAGGSKQASHSNAAPGVRQQASHLPSRPQTYFVHFESGPGRGWVAPPIQNPLSHVEGATHSSADASTMGHSIALVQHFAPDAEG